MRDPRGGLRITARPLLSGLTIRRKKHYLLVLWYDMDKLLEFGRKALFVIRVLSGYEERRIRSYRLQLQKRLELAQARKTALRRIPEQAILSEVRRMVEEMQKLNQKLEETEVAIDEYFKPIDKQVHTLMDIQLKGEEESMRQMAKAMQERVMQEQAAAQKVEETIADVSCHNQDTAPTLPGQCMEATENVKAAPTMNQGG